MCSSSQLTRKQAEHEADRDGFQHEEGSRLRRGWDSRVSEIERDGCRELFVVTNVDRVVANLWVPMVGRFQH